MNILITSAGRRVKIVEYFKRTISPIGGKVIGADCDSNAPALYFTDHQEIIPRINERSYIPSIISLCKKYQVDAIVSLIDPELEILAENKEKFEEINVQLVLSPLNMIKISYDKQETYHYLTKLGIPCVPTYSHVCAIEEALDKGLYSYPLVIKPRKGSASIGIQIINSKRELNSVLKERKENNLVIQPFYKDREFGIDVYIDIISGSLVDLFIKEKIKMRSGETDKSISVHNDKIITLIKEFVSKSNFKGPIDIDCFEHNGDYYISEINPRFGGGYPHAYEMGCNFMSYIVTNLKGQSNPNFRKYKYNEGSIMMKYDNVLLSE